MADADPTTRRHLAPFCRSRSLRPRSRCRLWWRRLPAFDARPEVAILFLVGAVLTRSAAQFDDRQHNIQRQQQQQQRVMQRQSRGQFREDQQQPSSHGNEFGDESDNGFGVDAGLGLEPTFDSSTANVTVTAGQPTTLPCSINHLGKYKVAWLDINSIPLTYEDRRVIDDTRFSVVRSHVHEWNLQVRDVRWDDRGSSVTSRIHDDRGRYRCTVNTFPVRSKLVHLHVKVPAKIVDSSRDDVTVQEGGSVTLSCNATGVPQPEVTWRLRPSAASGVQSTVVGAQLFPADDDELPDPTSLQAVSAGGVALGSAAMQACQLGPGPSDTMSGEILILHNVSRQCGGVYECTAWNEVPPSVSRQFTLTVEFSPEVTMPNRRIAQSRGRETILECRITAHPQATNYWEKDGRKISSSDRHRIEAYDEGDRTITLSLRIRIVDDRDYGAYRCVASNPLGKDSGVTHLVEPERRPIVAADLERPAEVNVKVMSGSTPSAGQRGHLAQPHSRTAVDYNNLPQSSGRTTGLTSRGTKENSSSHQLSVQHHSIYVSVLSAISIHFYFSHLSCCCCCC